MQARPVVAGDGRVALWCPACWPRRDELARAATAPLVSAVSAMPAVPAVSAVSASGVRSVSAIVVRGARPSRRRSNAPIIAAGLTAAAAAAVAFLGSTSPSRPASPITVAASVTPAAPAAEPAAAAIAPAALAPGPAAAPTAPADEPVSDEGTADPAASVQTQAEPLDLATLEDERPTLRDWIHPVTGSDELIPLRGTRKFGARREGLSRTLCGAGHCGVDLSGPRGRPVVAVAWGTVVRVEHSARGRDGRSGRYVRLAHPEGVFTSYMHLDAIAAEVSVGDEVDAGTVLGTLGKTAIRHGEQHLHFGLEIEDRGALIYVDPTPFLARAQVMPVPEQPLHLTPEDERAQW